MRFLIKSLIVVAVIGLLGAVGYRPITEYLKKRNQPSWRLAEVKEGTLLSVINSTGTIKPVLEVKVGSFVSGPIEDVFVDFNERVTKDQVLAKIDPQLYQATYDREQAVLMTRQAEVSRVQALLQQAVNNEDRARLLEKENPNFISQAEMDQFHFSRLSLEAQLKLAEASVKQAEASLKTADANLGYTEITSPVDGIVIDSKIAKGQTLAAQFQTPEMFVVAPDLDKEVYVFANVDEADIGFIRRAQEEDQPVHFTVDAYQDDLFEGRIEEVRYSSTTTQNVVTYPVVVAAANTELKLLPGMTAAISFRIDRRDNVLKIPNSALRFYPDRRFVRKKDHKILDGAEQEAEEEADVLDAMMSAEEKAELRAKRNKRHVWIAEGDKLKAVEVITGLIDSRYTEMVSGSLKASDKLVTGIKAKKGWGG